MRRFITSAALIVSSLATFPAHAAPLDVKQVPGSAQWVLHVDVDNVKQSQLWAWMEPRLKADANYARSMREIEAISGMRFPQDVRDVTLYGASADEKDSVVLLSAKADQNRLRQMLALGQGFGAEAYGDREILTWNDKGKVMFGAFAGPEEIVLGQNKELIQQALDLGAGKGQSMQGPIASGGVGGAGAGVMATLSGSGLGELLRAKDPKSPLVGHLQSAWLELSEQAGEIGLRGRAQARDAQAAERIRQTLEGVKAFVGLAGAAENADEKAKLAAAAMERAKVASKDAAVDLDWKLPLEQVKAFLQAANPKLAEPGATGSTPTAP
jgi:hypothetical protein